MSDLLQQAWLLRLNQDIEGCSRILARLDAEAEEAIYLRASLARSFKKLNEANALLDGVRAKLETQDRKPKARFYLERGLNHFFVQDYFNAFQDLLTAANQAEREKDRLVQLQALLNSLFCLKNLELPYEKTLAAFEKCLALYPQKEQVAGITSQYESFCLRRHLQAGDLQAFDRFSVREVGQSLFQKLFFYRLPYHAYHQDIGDELERVLTSPQHFFQKYYRVRTLQGVMHPEDKSETRLSDLIDRLYLWTWDWLRQPEEKQLARVMTTLKQIRAAGNFHLMTAEDYQLLSLAMGWVGLFDQKIESDFRVFLSAISYQGRKDFFPFFEVENLVISYFRALRDREKVTAADYLEALQANAIYARKDIHFRSLVNLGARAGFERVTANLKNLVPADLSPAGNSIWLQVDLKFWTVRALGHDLTIESEPLARAFRLLAAKPRVEAHEFVQFCFGQRRFDPVVHLPKLYNLLARMKGLLPAGLTVHQKMGVVFTKGDWSGIQFSGDLALADKIRVAAETHALRFSGEEKSTEHEKNHAIFDKLLKLKLSQFTRPELERHLEVSRASCNRLISHWQRKGLVEASGKGKNTTYKIVRPECNEGTSI